MQQAYVNRNFHPEHWVTGLGAASEHEARSTRPVTGQDLQLVPFSIARFGKTAGTYLAGALADATQSFATAFLVAAFISCSLGGGGSFSLHPRVGNPQIP